MPAALINSCTVPSRHKRSEIPSPPPLSSIHLFPFLYQLVQLLIAPDSIALLLDRDNNLITSVQDKEAVMSLEDAVACVTRPSNPDYDYQNYIVSTIESDYSGWKCCVFSPQKAVMANMTDANRSNRLFDWRFFGDPYIRQRRIHRSHQYRLRSGHEQQSAATEPFIPKAASGSRNASQRSFWRDQ